MRYLGFVILIIVAVAIQILRTPAFDNNKNEYCQVVNTLSNLPTATTQVIVVKSLGGYKAKITACQRQGKVWSRVLAPSLVGAIGENGVAPLGEKKEGDFKTPAGLYPIGAVFGWQPLAVKMDYKYITSEDKFIDDAHHKDYNTWVNGKTDAKSYENMLVPSYKYGAVINYNKHPTTPGYGSAIFMHLNQEPDMPTAGCITMDEPHLLVVLHWLDKKQHPYMYIS